MTPVPQPNFFMKGEAGMVTGVPPLLPMLLTLTALGVLNAPSLATGEAILSRGKQITVVNMGKHILCDTADDPNASHLYTLSERHYELRLVL